MIRNSVRPFAPLAALLLAILALLPACDSESDPTTPDPTGTVRGFVRHRYAQTPIAGATVGCANWTRVTDDEGRFEFAQVPCESTVIRATAAGYQPLELIRDVGEFQTLMLDLTPLDALADVSGTVRHHCDGPVAATVQLGHRSAIANSDGHWTLADVPLGPYPMVVTHSRYVPMNTTVVVWGDGQEIDAVVLRDSTFSRTVTADAGIRWDPTDGWEDNYGDENPLSLSRTPQRSLLVAIPLAPGPNGAVVRTAILHLTGYPDGPVSPPDSLTFGVSGVVGTWYETSVDAVNFPAMILSPMIQTSEVGGSGQDQFWALDVSRLYETDAGGALITPRGEDDSPMWVYSRESVAEQQRPRLEFTVRF